MPRGTTKQKELMHITAEKLTNMQKQFVDNLFIPAMSHEQAAINAGYAPKSASIAAARNMKLDNVQDYLQACVQQAIQSHSIRALSVVADMSINARGDKTKLEAAQDLLNRAGHAPVEKKQVALRGEMNVNINLG
tara:strand:+ start:881 stop:1285 length:405 start_codon:yes stop_codon:yes gene_type:complete